MSKNSYSAKLLAVLVLAAIALSSVPARAQDFKVDGTQKVHRFDVNNWLRAGAIPAGEEAVFDNYFRQYALLEIVAGKQSELPKARENIGRYFQTGKKGVPYDRLIGLTRDRMLEIMRARLPEVVKVNAMLVLGDLNLNELNPRNLTPLPSMLPTLLAAATTTSDRVSDSIRVAALVGVHRHAASGKLPAVAQAEVIRKILPLVAQVAPPPKRSPEGHAWIRASAARVLGALRNPGPNDTVVAALQSAAAEENAPHFMRGHMAEALGDIAYPAGTKIDFTQIAGTLGWVAYDAVRSEVDRFERLGGGSVDVPSRLLLLNRVHASLVGLEGPQGKSGIVKAAAATSHKPRVDAIHASVKALYATVLDAKSDGEGLYKAVMPKLTALEKTLPARGPSRVPAAKTPLANRTGQDPIRGVRAGGLSVQETR